MTATTTSRLTVDVPERTVVPPPVRRATAEEVIRRALDDLPDMPWGVARYLGERDYVGKRHKVSDCPVSHYVTTALFRAGYPEVRGVRVQRRKVRGLGAKVPLPWGVRAFVQEFDRGWYPRLVGGP